MVRTPPRQTARRRWLAGPALVLALLAAMAPARALASELTCDATLWLGAVATGMQALARSASDGAPDPALTGMLAGALAPPGRATHAADLQRRLEPDDRTAIAGALNDFSRVIASLSAGRADGTADYFASRLYVQQEAVVSRVLADHGCTELDGATPATAGPGAWSDTLTLNLPRAFGDTQARWRTPIALVAIQFVGLGALACLLVRQHRRHRRHACALPCRLQHGDEGHDVQMIDISRRGAKLVTTADIPLGAHVTLSVAGKDVAARVARQTDAGVSLVLTARLNRRTIRRIVATAIATNAARGPAIATT